MTLELKLKRLIVLCLCPLVIAGALTALVFEERENSLPDSDRGWEVRTNGTRGEPILLSTVEELQNMLNDLTADYVLANDIDASGTKEWNDGAGFMPVGDETSNFLGSFDGRGYSIKKLYINRPSDYVGLFGLVSEHGSVTDVGLLDVDIAGNDRTGAIVGKNSGSVLNCYTTGSVSGNRVLGGLIGYNDGGSVSNCYTTAIVSCISDYSGGLIGYNGGLVTDCFTTGSVTGTGRIGGLVGANYGSVERCYATGDAGGTNWVGGLVGYNFQACYVKNSYATGNVTRSSGTGSAFGGLLGRNHRGEVINCHSTGSVHYYGAQDPTNKGFCGEVDTGSHSYNMAGNFWDMDTSEQTSTSGEATGKTTTEMKKISTFTNAGWDFEDVWCMNEHNTYPLVRSVELPRAHAGPDQILKIGGQVTLNGSASTDNVRIVNYSWTFNDGTGEITLYGNGPTHTFTLSGLYIVMLNITDNNGFWSTDTMSVTVDLTPPEANAGSDRNVNEGTMVTFDGSSSTDNIGIADYQWTFHDGTVNVTLTGVAPTHRFSHPGVYTVTLNVTDTAGHWDTDSLTITVNDITPPAAHAGSDQTEDEGTMIVFDGTGSTDNVGIVNYTWMFNDGIENRTLYGVAPKHTFRVPGEYIVTLKVTDAVGNGDTDTMVLSVLLDSTPPIAHTGPDIMVDAGATVTFNGSASTDNVGIIKYTWTFNDGTGKIILYGVAPTHIFPVPKMVPVILNVTDDVGLWDTDIMLVTVYDNMPPAVHAGPDLIVYEGVQVIFDGTGSTDNVGIVNYTWTFTYNGSEVVLHGFSPTFQFWTSGDYSVTLTVSDAAGNTASDTMIVSVSSRDEQGWGIDDLWPIILILVIVIAAVAILVIRGRKKVSTPPDDQGWQQSRGQTLAQMAPETQSLPEPMYAPAPLTAPPSPGGFPPAEFPPVPAIHSSASVLPTSAFGRPPHDDVPHPPASAGVWFCPKCGSKLEEKYVFCLDCGYRRGE